MLPRPLRAIWGDLSNEEIKKFGILAATLFLIIGAYWLLRAMKNPSFDLLVGYEWQPTAKFVSVFSVVWLSCSIANSLTGSLRYTILDFRADLWSRLYLYWIL